MSDEGWWGGLDDELSLTRYALGLIREPLKRKALADIWIEELREAGYRAKHGTKWNGKYSADLPFVVAIPCPFEHPNEDDTDYATTLLIVRDDGWPYFNPELKGQCEWCNETLLEHWLLTCPRCEAGEDSEWHHPGHPKGAGHGRGYRGDVFGIMDDASPVSFVIWRFEQMRRIARAREWIEYREQAEARLRKGPGYSHFDDERFERMFEDQVERARRLLAAPVVKAIPAKAKPDWDEAATIKWLDELTDAEGQQVVPASASALKAWETVRSIEVRPPRNTIYAAQAKRK